MPWPNANLTKLRGIASHNYFKMSQWQAGTSTRQLRRISHRRCRGAARRWRDPVDLRDASTTQVHGEKLATNPVAFGHVPAVTPLNPAVGFPTVSGAPSGPMTPDPDVPATHPIPVPAHPDIARTRGNTVGFHYRRRRRDGDHRTGVGHACRIHHARTQRYGQSRYNRRISHQSAQVAHNFPRHVVTRAAAVGGSSKYKNAAPVGWCTKSRIETGFASRTAVSAGSGSCGSCIADVGTIRR
jgi:hypothetical protein